MVVSKRHFATALAITAAPLVGEVVLNEVHMAQESVIRGTATSWDLLKAPI